MASPEDPETTPPDVPPPVDLQRFKGTRAEQFLHARALPPYEGFRLSKPVPQAFSILSNQGVVDALSDIIEDLLMPATEEEKATWVNPYAVETADTDE